MSLEPVDVKLTQFTLSSAEGAVHIHAKGNATLSGVLTVQSDDVLSDLGKDIKKAVDDASEELARKEREAREALAKQEKEIRDAAARKEKELRDAAARKEKELR
ncbi:MAG: hypothetical protein KDK48_06150, partial [Chlamydiia bacterium]|nr:hypothetical protein [Chlamydiia bacterium]